MARKRYELTEKQINELQGVYHQAKDGLTRSRYQAVRLYALGYGVAEIMEITGCSRTSLLEWWRNYRQQGLSALADKRVGGNAAKLSQLQIEDLCERLHLYTPCQLFDFEAAASDGQFWTVADLKRAVARWYGVRYRSATTYQRLFAQCDFSYQPPGIVYPLREAQQVLAFEETLDKKRGHVAQEAPQTDILAEDETGLYLQTPAGAPAGQTPIPPAAPTRERVKFHEPLNLLACEEIVTSA